MFLSSVLKTIPITPSSKGHSTDFKKKIKNSAIMDLIIFLLLPGSCYTVSRNPPPPALVISCIRDIIVWMNANFQARSTDKSEVLVIGLKSLLYKYPRRAINTDMIMINASSVLQTS